ncbi:MAG: hypothetical protein HY318_15755 [Armatimonadetes bacterium]|nr:hypothetical protein [Armatimonadota bacterium]
MIEEIYILHHTHADIGYTDLQPLIYEKHVEIIDQALDLCTQTAGYPEDAQFRWIHEVSWPVMLYLQKKPQRAEELIRRCHEGRMEICGLYLHPTELYDRRSLEESLQPALRFSQRHTIPVTTVMATDIPGMAWSLPDLMAAAGFPYLNVSPNAIMSKPPEVERPFYWIGPDGGKVLVWLTDWRKGSYGEAHELGFPQGFDTMRERVATYLHQLEAEGYPWKVLALHFGADNYPPHESLPDLVAMWNEHGDLPRMRLATNREFFERLTGLHDGQFDSHRAAWPDWWSNGLGSVAFEAALSRETHCGLSRIEALQKAVGDKGDLWPLFEDLLFFDEHTFGARNAGLEPHTFEARASWHFKAAYIYRAADAARRREASLSLQLTGEGGVVIFNPLSEEYFGPARVPDDVPTLISEAGEVSPVQRSTGTPLSPEVPWSLLRVPPGATRRWKSGSPGLTELERGISTEGTLQNEFYRISFDTETGLVKSILDLTAQRELLDSTAPYGFGDTIHETIEGSQDRNALWDRSYVELPRGLRHTDAPFMRKRAADDAELLCVQQGPVFASVTARSKLPDARYLETEVRLWRGLRRIDVEVRVEKQSQERYESLYVAFPFALPNPSAYIHSGGAVFKAEEEQLPGSCRDFYAVEDFVAVEGADGWAILCPVDAPLVQLGQIINTGQWLDHLVLKRGCIYSWPVNNFWYTNFPGCQQGILKFRYSMTTGTGKLDTHVAASFGRGVRMGLTVR